MAFALGKSHFYFEIKVILKQQHSPISDKSVKKRRKMTGGKILLLIYLILYAIL